MDANDLLKLIDDVKNDKSIIQPWRNKAVSNLQIAQAMIHMGKSMTNLKEPEGWANPQPSSTMVGCICKPGMRNRSCIAQVHVA